MDQSKLKPALISGVIFGIVSLIPFVGALNCCCGWLLVCGVVAVKMYSNNSPSPLKTSDGFLVGGMSGAVAAIIIQMVNLVYSMINLRGQSPEVIKELILREIRKQPTTDPRALEMIMQWVDIIANNLIVFALVGVVIAVVIMALF